MARCKRRVKKIAGTVARALQPTGMKLIANIVGIVANTDWTNDQKREASVQLAAAALKRAGDDAKESMIRLAVETSVMALKEGEVALGELGEIDEASVEEALTGTD